MDQQKCPTGLSHREACAFALGALANGASCADTLYVLATFGVVARVGPKAGGGYVASLQISTLAGPGSFEEEDRSDVAALYCALVSALAPASYRPPITGVCPTCGAKPFLCVCDRGDHRSGRFDVASGRRS